MINKRIGEALIDAGLITPQDLENALKDQQALGGKIGTILFEKNKISAKEYLLTVSSQLGIPAVDFSKVTIKEELFNLIPKDLAWELLVLPVKILQTDTGDKLLLAMADPKDKQAMIRVRKIVNMVIRPSLAMEYEIRKILQEHYEVNYGRGDYKIGREDHPDPEPQGSSVFETYDMKDNEPPQPSALLEAVEGSPGDDLIPNESPGSHPRPNKLDLEEKLVKELNEVSIALKALLRLLGEKGIIGADEYKKIQNEIRLKDF